MTRCLLAVFCIALSPALGALSFRVAMKNADDAIVHSAVLCARRMDGDAEPIVRQIAVPSSGELALTEGMWELTLESDKIWAPASYARVGDAASIEAVPAAHLRARFVGETPSGVTVRMTPMDHDQRFRADVGCVVRDAEMHCTVPAGHYDLRIMPKKFVPQFRWDVDLAAGGSITLEPIALTKGAAVIGTVIREDRAPLPSDARVTLAPANAEREDVRASAMQVRPNAKGFFALTSVPPGQYVLTASAQSLTSDARTIEVVADRTAELNAPLLLDTPKRVRATIAPPRDPDGKAWIVELARERTSRHFGKVAAGGVDADGLWEQKNLPDGVYQLTILRRDGGNQWANEMLRVDGTDVDLVVTVPGDRVEGSVRFGDQPIAARVTFGGEYGAVRQALSAGDDGSFSGILPPSANDRWVIFVEADVPPTRLTLDDVEGRRDADGILHFEIALPRTAVLGTVVGIDGAPAIDAIVNLLRLPEGTIDQVFTASDGSFQFTGIAPGRYRVTAEDYMLKSEATELEMKEADTPMLRLALKSVQLLKGRVLTNESMPVIGANVSAMSWSGGPPWQLLEDRSNDAGAFALRVPPNTDTLDLIFAPPGFATIMTRMPVRTDMEMRVLADAHGGSLVVDVPADPGVLLAHGGANLWLSEVMQRSRGTVADAQPGRRRVSIPSLQAGEYDLCLRDRCVSGYVPPHGTLSLSLH